MMSHFGFNRPSFFGCRKQRFLAVLCLLPLLLFGLGFPSSAMGQGVEANQARKKAVALQKNGNFRDALRIFEELCVSPDTNPKLVPSDLVNATQCLTRLGSIKLFDNLVEKTINAHPKNWRLLRQAAQSYMSVQHIGKLVSGKYERGPSRGQGKMVNSQERDRVRGLQLMTLAMPLVLAERNSADVEMFYEQLASQLFYHRGFSEAWRLQYKTDLSKLPDLEDG
ncbi:MAG: hypothetical protein P8M80_16265, partial [Pirellulaceae bacterium]|nr:hypothetical protein [Pirellulaceae bacterium]